MTEIEWIIVLLFWILAALGFIAASLTTISKTHHRINNQLRVQIELDVGDRRLREHEENRKWRDALDATEGGGAPPVYTGPDWAKP